MSVLVLAEHDNRALKPATLNAVTAASEIAVKLSGAAGGDVHILVAGKECRPVAEAAAQVAGVAKVLLADDAAYEHGIAENLAPLVVKLAANYSHLLAPATTSGKNLMPRVAAFGRCRICVQRLPGRTGRQDRRAGALYRGRQFGGDPASRRHEGLQGHCRDQEGLGGADLPDRRLRHCWRSVQDPAGARGGARETPAVSDAAQDDDAKSRHSGAARSGEPGIHIPEAGVHGFRAASLRSAPGMTILSIAV